MNISISSGNTKLGLCANISLPHIVTCPEGVPCAKDCYAKKAWRMYPQVRGAWSKNLAIYTNNQDNYFNQIHDYLNNKSFVPKIFRWHVAGDCPDQLYVDNVLRICECNPHVQFLMFTKGYLSDFDFGEKMPNFSLIYSTWPGLDLPKDLSRSLSWLSTDERKPTECWKCPGRCENCYRCFELAKMENPIDIVFDLH